MTKLSELIGGMIKDVAQARVTADLLAEEYGRFYGAHPVLRHFEVPRFSIREVSLTLRFAVDTDVPGAMQGLDVSAALQEWNSILVGLGRSSLEAGADGSLLSQMREHLRGVRAITSAEALQRALEGRPQALVTEGVRAIASMRRELPSSLRRELPNARILRGLAREIVAAEFERTLPRLQQLAAASTSARSDLEILVSRDDIADIDPSKIQEIHLTLQTDEVTWGDQNREAVEQ